MRKKGFLIASILLFAFVIFNIDFELFLSILPRLSPFYLAWAFVFYVISFALRAVRWGILFPVSFARLFLVVSIHTFSNNIFPARSGELSFFYLMKEFDKTKLASGLVLVRFMDILAISLFFLVSLFFVSAGRFYWFVPPAATIVFLVIIFVAFKVPSVLPDSGLTKRVKDFAEKTKNSLKESGSKVIAVFTASLAVWTAKYIAFYFISKAVFAGTPEEINFFKNCFAVSFSELTTVLPVHSIGGYGTFEAGWTAGFMILGYPRELAVTTGFVFHTLLLSFSSVLGLPFLIRYELDKQSYGR